MIVVFEGPDGAGKSTLAKLVADKLDFHYRGRITRVGPDRVLQANSDDFSREGNWILDRCYWLSDIIYEPIYNGNESIMAHVAPDIFMKDNILYIHVTADVETLTVRYAERGDDLYGLDQILKAKARYDKYFKTLSFIMQYKEINTSYGSIDDNVQAIINYIKGE